MRSLPDMKKYRFPAVLFCGPFISSELHDDVQQDIGAGVPLVRGVVHMAVNLPVLQDALEIVVGEKLCDGPVKLNIQRILQLLDPGGLLIDQIGRASCRERV